MSEEEIKNIKHDPEIKRMLDLIQRVNDVNVFEFEGVMFIGERVEACKRFCNETSYPADFFVWLQMNYKQVIPS